MKKQVTAGLVMAMMLGASAADAAYQQVYLGAPYTDPSTNATHPAGTPAAVDPAQWVIAPGVEIIGGPEVILTTPHDRTSVRYIQTRQMFRPDQVIKVEFDYFAYNGNGPRGTEGGDGIALYLFDAAAPDAGQGGFTYSALGYCRMQGAYVGIGFDEWGNFAASCEKQVGGTTVFDGRQARDAVTIRGSQASNYALVETAAVGRSLDIERESDALYSSHQARARGPVNHVVAIFVPKADGKGYSISVSINGQSLLDDVDYPHVAPPALKLGISASSGAAANMHVLGGVELESTGTTMCPEEDKSLLIGAPAYVTGLTAGPYHYPFLTDGDVSHAGWNGVGRWTGLVSLPAVYGVDLSGAPCVDRDGGCAAKPGKGAERINTVVVWSRQDDGAITKPTDSTVFTQHGAVDFRVEGKPKDSASWTTLMTVTGNTMAKSVVTFPEQELTNIQVVVTRSAGNNASPIVEIEAFRK